MEQINKCYNKLINVITIEKFGMQCFSLSWGNYQAERKVPRVASTTQRKMPAIARAILLPSTYLEIPVPGGPPQKSAECMESAATTPLESRHRQTQSEYIYLVHLLISLKQKMIDSVHSRQKRRNSLVLLEVKCLRVHDRSPTGHPF